MTPPTPRWTDQQIDQVIGRLLQIGVLLATLVTLAGGVLYLLHHGGSPADFSTFSGPVAGLNTLSGIVHGMMAGQLPALVQAGLVLLILTPMARVALTLGAFLIQRDRLYVVLTAVVLAVLMYGLFWV